jgi:hypothetical protein
MNHYVTWEGKGEARGGFRRLFATFLEEASAILNDHELGLAGEYFRVLAEGWSEIDEAFRELCHEQDSLPSRLTEAARAIKKQAKLEAEAYGRISRAITC